MKSLLSLRLYHALKRYHWFKNGMFQMLSFINKQNLRMHLFFLSQVCGYLKWKRDIFGKEKQEVFPCLVFYLFFFMLLTVDVALEEDWYQERLYWPAPPKMARLIHLILGCHLKQLILLMSISMVSWKESLFLGILYLQILLLMWTNGSSWYSKLCSQPLETQSSSFNISQCFPPGILWKI